MGKDQTLTTSPASPTRGLPPLPPRWVTWWVLRCSSLLPHRIPELSLKLLGVFEEEGGAGGVTSCVENKRVKVLQSAPWLTFLSPPLLSSPLSPCRIHPSVSPTVAAHLCPGMTCWCRLKMECQDRPSLDPLLLSGITPPPIHTHKINNVTI